jgi:hypothetical protein
MPTQAAPAMLSMANRINAVEVAFSRPISPSGFRKTDLQKGLTVQLLSGDAPILVTGTLTLDKTRTTVQFTTTD